MAKKKTWFSLIKRFFISEPQTKLEKKDKRKRWAFRLLKIKELAPLSAPSPARERLSWQQTATEQSNNNNNSALPVIVAIDNAQSAPHQHNESQESAVESKSCVVSPQISHQHEMATQHQSATKIQASFRGYLARKALGALKGVVKLQALIRGWAVRQQAINTLKCLQSIVNIQSEVCSKRCERIKDSLYCQENKPHDYREKYVKIDLNSQKRWEDSTLTKEELMDHFLTKRDASIKRERVKEYYLNHRKSAETERDKVHGRRRYWLEQWVDAQLAKSENSKNRDEEGSRLPNVRRSYHHRKQRSTGDDNSLFPGSPSVPAYMASTESAKAKARSLSSPRLRPLSFDVCSEIASPYKHKLSPISSINSELTSSSWVGNHLSSSRRSPGLKGVSVPIKSTMSTKDLRVWGIHHQNGEK